MASHTINPHQVGATTFTAPHVKSPMSKGWPIGLGIACCGSFIAGAPLYALGIAYFGSDLYTPSYSYDSVDESYASMITAGYVFLSIGGALFVAFCVVVIARQRQKQRFRTSFPYSPYQGAGIPGDVTARSINPYRQTAKPPLSKRWLTGHLIGSIIYLSLGAILFGVTVANADSDSFDGTYIASCVCFGIGGIVFIVFWTMVFVRQRQRRRFRNTMPPPIVQVNGAAPAAVPVAGYQGVPAHPLAPTPYTAQQQPSHHTTELSGQQPPRHTPELSGQQPLRHTTELSGQQLLELSPTPASTVRSPPPPFAAVELGAQYTPQQYDATAPAQTSPPISTTSELPALVPPKPVATPPTSQTPPQPLRPAPTELAPSVEKQPIARYCRYCGAALDVTTRLCGQCGT